MSLTLHSHPLASFCWKVLIGLYENDTPFENILVDLGDGAARERFFALTPWGKMPALQDSARGEVVAETTIILEYLDRHYPGPVRLLPSDPDAALQARYWDRVFDLYVQTPMQKIVADRLRPADRKDPLGVEEARGQLLAAYPVLERQLAGRTWMLESFGLVECAAFPALFYADKVEPIGEAFPAVMAYLDRLHARASVRRVLTEAEPYFQYFPQA